MSDTNEALERRVRELEAFVHKVSAALDPGRGPKREPQQVVNEINTLLRDLPKSHAPES